MFKITSTRAIEWAGFDFTLHKGDNELESRAAVPVELREKLVRFRGLGILAFDGAFSPEEVAAVAKLADLTEVQLYARDKVSLAELAKAEGISVPEGSSKTELLSALVPKCKPRPVLDPPRVETTPEPAKDSAQKSAGKGKSGKTPPPAPVSGGADVTSG